MLPLSVCQSMPSSHFSIYPRILPHTYIQAPPHLPHAPSKAAIVPILKLPLIPWPGIFFSVSQPPTMIVLFSMTLQSVKMFHFLTPLLLTSFSFQQLQYQAFPNEWKSSVLSFLCTESLSTSFSTVFFYFKALEHGCKTYNLQAGSSPLSHVVWGMELIHGTHCQYLGQYLFAMCWQQAVSDG